MLGLLVAFSLLGMMEVVVRVLGLAPPDARVVMESDPDNGVRLRALGISTDTPHVSPWFAASSGGSKILWLGESAAAGFPFYPQSTPARWMTLALRRSGRPDAEVMDAAIAGIQSDWMEEATRLAIDFMRPDIVAIYAGNNEFLESFLSVRASASAPLFQLASVARRSALYRVLRQAIAGAESVPPTRPAFTASGHIDPPLGELDDQVLRRLASNLRAIVDAARDVGAKVVIVRPAAACRGILPLSSVFGPSLPLAEQERLERLIAEAEVRIVEGDAAGAEALLREVLDGDEGLALAHYRLGEALDALSRGAEAADHYQRALDGDERPGRVNARVAAVLQQVAREAGVLYLDANDWVREGSSDGLERNGLLVDHCHLSIEGQYVVATGFERALVENGMHEPRAVSDPELRFTAGMAVLGVSVAEALLPEVQLAFGALIAAYELPSQRVAQLSRARNIVTRVLEQYPDQPRALAARAFCAAAVDDVDGARADFDRVAASAPQVLIELGAAAHQWDALRALLARAGVELEQGRVRRVEPVAPPKDP